MNSREEMLVREFRVRGILTAVDVSEALGVSQPTVSRLISGLGPERVVRIGKARSRCYGLNRPIRGKDSSWTLYQITPDAGIHLIGRLHALEGGRWYVDQSEPWDTFRGREFIDGLYPGLPWFLQDLRPRGFLGRSYARYYASLLGLPADPLRWSDDDALVGLVQAGEDMPGALVVGRNSLSAVQLRMTRGIESIESDSRAAAYCSRADSAMKGGWPGSSAAGEQPKFTACVSGPGGMVRHVIVKFSGSGGRPEDRRWADLLVAEHLANTTLVEAGIPCAETAILEYSGRFFLESTRFDRVGAHGRRGLVSLEALDSAFFGAMDTPWTEAAVRLLGDQWITQLDAERLSLLWWFGALIGNTDMHYGNVSLFMERFRPLELAPTYDMVPMQYRPDLEGRLPSAPIVRLPPPPESLAVWGRASILAERFWARLSSCDLLSAGFRDLAARNAQILAQP